mgnify:CR=1 FL=1
MERRVVVTGMGAVTPIGNNVEEFWKGIKEGKCGIDNITRFDTTNYKVKLAAEVKDLNLEDYMDKRAARRLDRYSQLAMVAAKEVMADSGINETNTDMNKVAIIVGAGIGGLSTIEEQTKVLVSKGHDRVSPMFIPMSILNMATGNIAIEYGLKGESIAIATACATGTHCIGEGYRLIKHGYQEAALVGGAEGTITELSVAGFTNIKALCQATDKNRASIPFDKERSGFVMGEGAGLLMLEELEHAKARGAKIYAEIVGYGASTDAYHITSPAPGGEGGARAMVDAIKDAGINPEDIDYINAHGTSTHLNDSFETAAIKTALGEAANAVMVSSTKSNTGHLLGAAGAVEAIACIKAIGDSYVPPTINYKVPDEECDLDIVPNEGRNKEIKYAMSNSLGFGGHNSTVIIKKFEH